MPDSAAGEGAAAATEVSWSTKGLTDASLVSNARASCSRSHAADGPGRIDSHVQQDDLAGAADPASAGATPHATAGRGRTDRTRSVSLARPPAGAVPRGRGGGSGPGAGRRRNDRGRGTDRHRHPAEAGLRRRRGRLGRLGAAREAVRGLRRRRTTGGSRGGGSRPGSGAVHPHHPP